MPTTTLDERPREPAIDPRIRARRIAVRRDEGRRRLSRLVRLAVLVAVIAAGALATRTALLDVDELDIAGNVRTERAALVAASGIAVGDAMTDVDLASARDRIDLLPWVDEVTVARAWPGTIRIRVTERVPVSAVEAGQGGWLLVDRDGRLLERVDAPPPGLVAIADAAKAGGVGETLPPSDADALLVARSVPPSLVGRVVAVAPAAEGGLELRLDDGARVLLGPPDPLEGKMLAVATMLGQVDGRCMATLDVRVPGNPVLTRTPGCA